MFDFAPHDTLYHLSLVLVAGIVGGEIIGRLRLPKVTGWIFTGILLRATAPYHMELHGAFAGLPGSGASRINSWIISRNSGRT